MVIGTCDDVGTKLGGLNLGLCCCCCCGTDCCGCGCGDGEGDELFDDDATAVARIAACIVELLLRDMRGFDDERDTPSEA